MPDVMRVTTLKASGGGSRALIDYYSGLARDQLRREGAARGPVDYYLDRDEPPGRWCGTGREALGLHGEVRPEQLEALLIARHPQNGRRLGRSFGDASARGFDATFSAPKSVSVLWALSDDPWVRAEVLAAHDAAVVAALDWFERHGAVTRRGRDGVDQVDAQGIVAALFRQHTSRSLDPQLHAHAVIASKVQDPTGKWLSLDARFLKRQQRSISCVYAAALRSELTERLGVSWSPVVEGHADIAGMPVGLLERQLGRKPTQRALTTPEVRAMVLRLKDIVAALGRADPEAKRRVYEELGVQLTYHPGGRVRVEAGDPHVLGVGVGGGT